MSGSKASVGQSTQTPGNATSVGHGSGYTVLARRYRSRSFDEIVGQKPIARTLRNAIAAGRTAHAYLFCGTRGVGKTSMARIFAKALNATDELEEADAIAQAILRGDDLDVIEIDGASNRGVQEARDLIAGAGLSPARCRYKIYIIDEVHMLTREAFNALLKTMEEPPAHVKFILCTTDPVKVPATIQSRCQRFDFRTIPAPLIADQLRLILRSEGVDADEDVIRQVASLGRGSMRDALSLLDRLIAGGEKKLTIEMAEQTLGLPDHSLLEQVIDAIVACDAKAALTAGDELLRRGSTVEQALEMLADHLRTLVIVVTCGRDCELLELSSEGLDRAVTQAAHFDAPALVHMIAICDAVANRARSSAAARALFDAALVRICMSERFADIAALLDEAALPSASGSAGKKKRQVPEVSGREIRAAPPEQVAPPRGEPASASAPAASGESMIEVKNPSAEDGEVPDDRLWPRVVQVAAASPKDRVKVDQLTLRSFDGRTLHLAVAPSAAPSARYLAGQADSIVQLVKRATGRVVKVRIDPPPSEPIRRAVPEQDLEAARRLPLVRKAIEIFDAAINDVQTIEQTGDAAEPPEEEGPDDDV